MAILCPADTPLWFHCLKDPAQEFSDTPLSVLQGAVPDGLRGTLYCNGPAKFERAGTRVEHWFDGDGAVLAIHFAENQAQANYRFVRTREFLDEEKAGTFLYGGYGSLPAVGMSDGSNRVKNTANTSVLVLPEQLLALWEGGMPYALDPFTLQTIGLDDLGMVGAEDQPRLLEGQAYSAHPKRDPKTGDLFNFGLGLGEPKLSLYRSDRFGRLQKQTHLPLPAIPFIHDFVMAGPYLVFCIPPVILRHPIQVRLGMKSYSDCLVWKPEIGTQILVVDRETFEVVGHDRTDPWFQWHCGNGFINVDGHIQLSLCQYDDFATNQNLREVVSGQPKTPAPSRFWQGVVDPQTGALKTAEMLVERVCEYPTFNPDRLGLSHERTFLSIRKAPEDPRDLLNGLACFHHGDGTLTEAPLPDASYPTEAVYVADPNREDGGWVLSVVYHGDRHGSEVWIFECDRLGDEPVCRLGLPSFVPIGFHGRWRSA